MCIKRVNSFDELSNLYSNLKGLLDIKKENMLKKENTISLSVGVLDVKLLEVKKSKVN